MHLSSTLSVTGLLDLTGSDREAKAYAVLYAAFRKTEISENPVRDALDCLIPFIAPYIRSIPGKPILSGDVCSFIKLKFGFDIPLYAMQQLINDLPKHGYADYSKATRVHIAKYVSDDFEEAKVLIDSNFDHIASRLENYAASLQFHQQPPSGSWGDALIRFLKGAAEADGKAVAKIRKSLVDAHKAETAVVGGFVHGLHSSDMPAFEMLLQIFLGILVEEFISSVSELGQNGKPVDVVVLYDTAVILRLLGTSGRLLRSATEELTRYLQDLGCSVCYFGGNEAEVANIFNTIVYIKDSGGELEGETAEAISTGEVNISEIRMLQNSFTERLAAMNVFPADDIEPSAAANAKHQINESGFSAFLLQQANAAGRAYGVQNREHDAQYLGTVMRLRGGIGTRDFSNSRYVFVTSNKFLATMSRRFLIKERALLPQQVPPMMSVGQVATIAWLMKDRKLAPEKAGRELLANCYAAVRPDAEWFKHFREGMEKVTGSIESYGRDAVNTITLQAARRIAQEESLGSATLVRELNMAEILSRAEAERERMVNDQRAELEAIRQASEADLANIKQTAEAGLAAAHEAAALEKRQAVELVSLEAEQAAAEMVRIAQQESASRFAKIIVSALRVVLLASFAGLTLYTIYLRVIGQNTAGLWIGSAILGLASVITFANFLKIPFVANWIPNLEAYIAKRIASGT